MARFVLAEGLAARLDLHLGPGQAWDLETFAVSTRNMQDSGCHGILAKSVELWFGGRGPWRKVGTFQVGKLERQEYPLPAGSRAKQVKPVVAVNHGNTGYTKIAELDLFGTRSAPAVPAPTAGDYRTNYEPMRFVQGGEEVFGCYDWTGRAEVRGTVVGRNARVVWYEERSGAGAREGTATFAVLPEGDLIWGVWYEGGRLEGEWAGPRVGESEGPKCTPHGPARKRPETLQPRAAAGRGFSCRSFADHSDAVRRQISGAVI